MKSDNHVSKTLNRINETLLDPSANQTRQIVKFHKPKANICLQRETADAMFHLTDGEYFCCSPSKMFKAGSKLGCDGMWD